mmetsp:Transcript_100933/g.261268  ORF Transcript_100933/g.261268 Transcript_100933/m.261268 type:complete len:236 (-) Transcript_100933:238-945(-)
MRLIVRIHSLCDDAAELRFQPADFDLKHADVIVHEVAEVARCAVRAPFGCVAQPAWAALALAMVLRATRHEHTLAQLLGLVPGRHRVPLVRTARRVSQTIVFRLGSPGLTPWHNQSRRRWRRQWRHGQLCVIVAGAQLDGLRPLHRRSGRRRLEAIDGFEAVVAAAVACCRREVLPEPRRRRRRGRCGAGGAAAVARTWLEGRRNCNVHWGSRVAHRRPLLGGPGGTSAHHRNIA